MNKDVLIVILIAVIVTLSYFLLHPIVKTQRKLPESVPLEQAIGYSQENHVEPADGTQNRQTSAIVPEFRMNDETEYKKNTIKNSETGFNATQDRYDNSQNLHEQNIYDNSVNATEQKKYASEPKYSQNEEKRINVLPQTPVVTRGRRTLEDNLSVCSPYKETMTTEYMGMKMNYSIEIVGWVKNKCVLNFESKMLDMGTTFEDTYGFEPGTVEVAGFAPKVRCEFTQNQLRSVGDSFLLEEKTTNRKMLKDPNQIEIPEMKDMSVSDLKLLKILLSDRACKVVNANDFLQIFESLFSF